MTTGMIAGGIVLLLALLVGLAWEFGSRAKARLAAKYPPPGQLVDVGGYRLHINCQGAHVAGSPTVVMEAAHAEPGLSWASVQPEVAKFTRVCTYDRAGLGWSELSPAPRTASNIVNELYTLLGRAGVEPPYVLVGHSIGGLFVRVYAHEHPEQVAGMVLVDASHDEQEVRVPEAIARMNKSGYRSMAWGFRLLQMLSSLGLLALLGEKARHMWPSPIPQEARDTYLGVAYSSAHHLEAAARESTSLQESLSTARARPIRSLGDIPLIVVSAGQLGLSAGHGISTADVEQMKVAHDGMQAELATLSTRGKCVIAQESSHYVQVSQPALVVDAIREVVEAARR